eukprot:1054783-Pleurochrysis_carterae.AAC.2
MEASLYLVEPPDDDEHRHVVLPSIINLALQRTPLRQVRVLEEVWPRYVADLIGGGDDGKAALCGRDNATDGHMLAQQHLRIVQLASDASRVCGAEPLARRIQEERAWRCA